MRILQNINGHGDLAQLNDRERQELCGEIREFLVSKVSRTGGHLASNLGVVELTVAIETVFDTTVDRLVFDVGHQSYVHKLLTGRQADFDNLRQFGGIAGFPKPKESCADAFVAGHASSSVSIALGMARARTMLEENYNIVALMGDGAATGGMAYEGLNDAAASGEPMVIILNDNAMSIDRNVGGMANHLSRLRSHEDYLDLKHWYASLMDRIPGGRKIFRFTRRVKERIKRMLIPSTIFDNMGLTYLGPVDGHDLPKLISLMRIAKDMKRPVLLHVITQKGRGYIPAQEHPSKFHGVGKFDPVTGETAPACKNFSDAFGEQMLELAKENPKVCAITAAMPGGTGLLEFKKQFPARTFDVGIAEEHAVSMAGGLAKQGAVPVVAIYSTFLQRAYDQIQQDVAMQGLHVVFAVDRAGLVGEDGETHHGIYDLGFLRQMPGMTVLAPASMEEAQKMLRWAVMEQDGPVAIRYPRGGDKGYSTSDWNEKTYVCHRDGDDVTLVTYGTLVNNAMEAADILAGQGVQAKVMRLLKLTDLPAALLSQELSAKRKVVVVEEICGGCGIKEELSCLLRQQAADVSVHGIDLGPGFVPHGDMQSLYKQYGLDSDSIAKFVMEVLRDEN